MQFLLTNFPGLVKLEPVKSQLMAWPNPTPPLMKSQN